MILTNKFNADLNMDAIMEDFDIFRVTKESSKLDRTNILDTSILEFKARAVQYQFGRNAFVLFDKGRISHKDFKAALEKEYKDITVYQVTREDLDNEEFCKNNFFYGKRALVQLLLNSIKSPKNEAISYNNLTGAFYYVDPSWISRDKKTKEIYMLYSLEIVLDMGMFLNLKVKTFRSNPYAKGERLYVIDKNTGNLRKRLKTDDSSLMSFVEESYASKHNTVDYINIANFSKFRSSKLGVMERFLRDVEIYLGKYLVLTPEEVTIGEAYKISKKEKADIGEKEMGDMLNKRGVVIVDENNTDKSKMMVEKLRFELKEYYGVDAEEGKISIDKYNIRIIHTPEYYEEMGLKDPHIIGSNGYIVQHMMEETEHFKKRNDKAPASDINKIVQELIIKGDVREKEISIYDWPGLGSGKEWSFVIRNKIKKPFDPERKSHLNRAKQPTFDNYLYKRLTVKENGILDFKDFSDEDFFLEDEEAEKIIFAFEDFYKKYHKDGNDIDGLVYSDINNIHAIILTPGKTMPNTKSIYNGLKETDRSIEVSKESILNAISVYEEICGEEDYDYLDGLKERLSFLEEKTTINDVRKAMQVGKKSAKKLNRFMHENYNIWISPEMKDSDFADEYLIDNLLDIKFYKQPDYEMTPSFYYYVGTKSQGLKLSIHNACAIRKVVSETGELEFEELLPLMAVEFVRNKQYTVLPFPFKYLREWRG